MYNDTPESYHIPDKYVFNRLDYKNRDELVNYYVRNALQVTQSMFEWKNLPDTITQRDMELLIQTNGYGVFLENKGKHYCLFGTLGGRWNFNYMPTRAVVANPYIKDVNGSYRIQYGYEYDNDYYQDDMPMKGECVVITNDPMYVGMIPTIQLFANRMTDTYISRRMVTIMSRYINVFVAKDNNAYENVKEFLSKLEKGDLAAIFDKNSQLFEEGNVKTLPLAQNAGTSRMLTELIECEQYDKASFYNEIGIMANYNMKRESINSNESQLNEDALRPKVDAMLECRQLACERINKTFGLNLSVDFSSVWKFKKEELDKMLEEPNQLGNEQKEVNDERDDNVSSGDSGGNDNGSDIGEHRDGVGDDNR